VTGLVVVVAAGRVVVVTLGIVVVGAPVPVPSARVDSRDVADVAEAVGVACGTVVEVVVVVAGVDEEPGRPPEAGRGRAAPGFRAAASA
jgi:hypothetical protein